MGKPGCGGCHPGGGGFEFDRDGKRYDLRLRANPGLKKTLDGDYYKSHWDKTGVAEADCFICHLDGYNFKLRNKQLKLWNYKWAAIAASGIGSVKGTVARVVKKNGKLKKQLTGRVPVIKYNKRLFNSDGKLAVDLSWPTPSKNCTFCHAFSDRKKRGFSWNDMRNHDIHNLNNMECVHCHPSIDGNHNFAKGDENVSTVRDDLDGQGMLTCKECHYKGIFGATKPTHTSVRPSHLEKISCETCHIPKINANGGSTFDVTSGEMISYGRLENEANLTIETAKDAKIMPIPTYNQWVPHQAYNHKNHKLEPVNPFLMGIIYTNLDADGIHKPLFLKELKKTYSKIKGKITKHPHKSGPFKGKPKLYKDEEIKLYLSTLKKVMKGNKRFKAINPHMHFFGTLIHIGKDGKLVKEKDTTWAGKFEAFNINHNVAPAHKALGAGGCLDCHGWNGKVFRQPVMAKLWNEDGVPVFIRNGQMIGCNAFSFWLTAIYQTVVTPYVSILILIFMFVIILHYTGQGPKGADLLLEPATIQRFTIAERWTHLFRMLSFLGLTFTGAIFFYNSTAFLEIFFGNYARASLWHIILGFIFIIFSGVSFMLWRKDAVMTDYDREWMKKMGGYFSKANSEEPVPAGRLNAGQKIAFWWGIALTIIMAITGIPLIFKLNFPIWLNCILTTVHGFTAIVFVATIIGHAYLGTLANPGTWRTMLDGMVGEKWAKKHHSRWYEELRKEE